MENLRSNYKIITLNKRQECDFELLVNGAFSPLKGFISKKDYQCVVDDMRLHSGSIWALPITLCIDENKANELRSEKYVLLENETGLLLGLMNIEDEDSIYKPDISKESINVYGADDDNHPYVKILKNYEKEGKIYNIGGEIVKYILPPRYDFKEFRKTPDQVKEEIKNRKWNKVIGFQTRNPMHRSHYELTKYALNQVGKDAKLLLHPVVGITQDCDINYHLRVKCYKELMNYYDEDQAMLSLLPLTMRMAGPREAVMHAQIRKNYGCTHFIVGRDHAGPSYKKKDGSDFYGHYDAQDLLIKHSEEIGIEVIISKLIVYALHKETSEGIYLPIDKVDKDKYEVMNISGTKQREILRNGENLPDWFSFPTIATILKNEMNVNGKPGLCIYFVGLSGSGKSTIANYLISKIYELTNNKVTYLDGDIVRRHLSKGLGFSKEDRSMNVRRIGYVCSEVVKHGGITIAANIAPYEEDRNYNRKIISEYGNYVEVFVNTTLDNCIKRDVKGLYKMAIEGKIKQFTGISDPFENPTNPEIELNGSQTIDESLNTVIDYLKNNNFL